jgi:hypothetical protein
MLQVVITCVVFAYAQRYQNAAGYVTLLHKRHAFSQAESPLIIRSYIIHQWSAMIGEDSESDGAFSLSVRALRFLCVRGRGGLRERWECRGGNEQTARRFAGPEKDNSGVAQVSDRARFCEGMKMRRTRRSGDVYC